MALYLPSYNLVFIHIYKTAGTSLRNTLMKLDKDYQEIGIGHADYYDIADKVEGKTLFSVVRNPYDWIYSLYQYAKTYNSHPFHSYCVTHSFDQFVVWHFENLDVLNSCGMNGKLQTQTEYLSFNGQIMVPYILKMENLEVSLNEFFRNVFKTRGIIRLDTLNSTPYERPNPKSFSAKTIQLINEKYHNDFINFNYEMI